MKEKLIAELPVIHNEGKYWLLLKPLSNTVLIRAVYISKKRQVHESDSHHCNEVLAKGSVRIHPKFWNVN